MNPMSDVTRWFGYRPSQPFGEFSHIGWRVWVGPFSLARVHGCRFSWWSARGAGWDTPPAYSVVAFGLAFSWCGRRR